MGLQGLKDITQPALVRGSESLGNRGGTPGFRLVPQIKEFPRGRFCTLWGTPGSRSCVKALNLCTGSRDTTVSLWDYGLLDFGCKAPGGENTGPRRKVLSLRRGLREYVEGARSL